MKWNELKTEHDQVTTAANGYYEELNRLEDLSRCTFYVTTSDGQGGDGTPRPLLRTVEMAGDLRLETVERGLVAIGIQDPAQWLRLRAFIDCYHHVLLGVRDLEELRRLGDVPGGDEGVAVYGTEEVRQLEAHANTRYHPYLTPCGFEECELELCVKARSQDDQGNPDGY